VEDLLETKGKVYARTLPFMKSLVYSPKNKSEYNTTSTVIIFL